MDVIEPQIVCEKCSAEFHPGEGICSSCGHPVSAELGHTPRRLAVPSVRNLSQWQVLAILFLGTGPLGLPILWRNENFSWLGKLTVSCLLVACTMFLAGVLWYLLVLVSQPVLELIELMRSTA